MKRHAPLAIAMCLCGTIGCESQTDLQNFRTAARITGAADQTSGNACAGATASTVPQPGPDAGVVVFKIVADGVDPCTIGGHIVGMEGSSSLTRASANTFYLAGFPEGAHDVIIAANTRAATLTDEASAKGQGYSVRVNGIQVDKGQTKEQSVRLLPAGEFRGTAKLAGQTAHGGIDVRIAGTSYAATTDASGNFSIQGVPVGSHTLEFASTGYHPAIFQDLRINPESVTSVPNVVMVLGAGEGSIALLDDKDEIIKGDLPVVTSRVVRFVVAAKGRPTLMKISEDGNFANIDWQPFTSMATYTFKKVGLESGGRITKRLSVKTLEGSTEGELEKSVILDMFAESRGQSLIELSHLDADGQPSLTLTAKLKVPGNATEMRLSLREDFAGTYWEPKAETKTFKLARPGEYTVYAQFRDKDLIETEPFNAVIDVELFPKASVGFALAASRIKFPAVPHFSLTNVKMPITKNVKLLISARADQSDLIEVDYQPAVAFDLLGEARLACGRHTLRLVAKYTDPDTGDSFTSGDPVTAAIEYRCMDVIPSIQGEALRNMSYATSPKHFMVWGGRQTGGSRQNRVEYGHLYDFATGQWTLMNPVNGPGARESAKTFWTGQKFGVYGGNGNEYAFDGGLYDPTTKTWTRIPAPTEIPNIGYSDTLRELLDPAYYWVFYTGTKLIVWGYHDSYHPAVGFVYDFAAGDWTVMPTSDKSYYAPDDPKYVDPEAPEPSCYDSDAYMPPIFAGGKLIVWGGVKCDSDPLELIAQGSVYDPELNDWSFMATEGQPALRFDHAEAALGNEFFVWGGRSVDQNGDPVLAGTEAGGIYDPATNQWRPTSPAPFAMHRGSYFQREGLDTRAVAGKIVVWGGWSGSARVWSGLVYDPVANTWAEVNGNGAPRYVGMVSTPPLSGSKYHQDYTTFDSKYLYVVTRASTREEVETSSILVSAYDVAAGQWRPLAQTSNDLPAGFVPSVFRDSLKVFPTGRGLLTFQGNTPEDRPDYETIQMNGLIHYVE